MSEEKVARCSDLWLDDICSRCGDVLTLLAEHLNVRLRLCHTPSALA